MSQGKEREKKKLVCVIKQEYKQHKMTMKGGYSEGMIKEKWRDGVKGTKERERWDGVRRLEKKKSWAGVRVRETVRWI